MAKSCELGGIDECVWENSDRQENIVKKEQKISIKYNDNTLCCESENMTLKTTYQPKEKDIYK